MDRSSRIAAYLLGIVAAAALLAAAVMVVQGASGGAFDSPTPAPAAVVPADENAAIINASAAAGSVLNAFAALQGQYNTAALTQAQYQQRASDLAAQAEPARDRLQSVPMDATYAAIRQHFLAALTDADTLFKSPANGETAASDAQYTDDMNSQITEAEKLLPR